jgi:hypothetical protein
MAITLIGVSGVGWAQSKAMGDVAEIVDKMVKSEAAQLQKLQRYRMTRTYRLKSGDGSKDVQMLARVVYNGETGKSIQVLEARGTEGLYRRALQKVLDAEVKTSHEDGRGATHLGPENYSFRLIGTEVREGRNCYALQLLPKRRSKYLLDGKAWVATDDYGLVALEGRPAASLSFWVGKPFITQVFEKVGDIWLLSRNHSEVDARIIGKIALTIETQDVEMGGTKVEMATRHRGSGGVVVD